MHPYQDQVNRMWDIFELEQRATKNGFWLESLSLSYILLEVELRLLLSSKAGEKGTPVPSYKIDKQSYLMKLADLAKRHGFIDKNTWKNIQVFNEIRSKAIHRLIQGEIKYADLETAAKNSFDIIYEIQNKWLPVKWGKEERKEGEEEG